MRQRKMLISEAAVVLVSCTNYTSVTLLNTIWGLDLSVLLPILFIESILMGMITIDTKKALVYACTTIFFGTALATLVMATPPILLGEGAATVDSVLNTALMALSKLLIFNIIVFIIGALLGSFAGEWLEPIEGFEI